MITFLTILYVAVCIFLILVVLLQSGKGGGMGGIGGGMGGAGQQVFGGAGAGNLLTKLTGTSAALFMILSMTLAYLSSSSDQAMRRAAGDLGGDAGAQLTGEAADGGTASGEDTPPAADEAAPAADEPAADEAAAAADEPAADEAAPAADEAAAAADEAAAAADEPAADEAAPAADEPAAP